MARRRGSRGRGAQRGGRRYAAVVVSRGVHVVEYARTGDQVEIVAGVYEEGRAEGGRELAGLLSRAVAGLGGRGGELSLGLSGLGTAHHVLALPDAEEKVLGPVVGRELLRYYPDLDDPVIDFVRVAEPEAGPEPKREVLVGAAPAPLLHRLAGGLREARVRLRHVTVLPQVLQSLYEALDGADAPAVLVLALDSGPLIGCFHGGALRLYIEPPPDLHGRPVRGAVALAEQVQRANLFLRQQFPSSAASRVLLGADEAGGAALGSELAASLGLEVSALPGGSAGALAALGVALSGEASARIELLPEALRPMDAGQRSSRALAAAGAAAVAVASLWWAGAAVLSARAEAASVRATESRVEARLGWAEQARTLLERRESHEQRLLFLDRTASTRAEVRRILGAISEATGPAVRLESLRLEPSSQGWRVVLTGRATGSGSAAAVRSVDALYRGIPARLPVTELELGDMEAVDGGGAAPVALAFNMSFIVQVESDLQR